MNCFEIYQKWNRKKTTRYFDLWSLESHMWYLFIFVEEKYAQKKVLKTINKNKDTNSLKLHRKFMNFHPIKNSIRCFCKNSVKNLFCISHKSSKIVAKYGVEVTPINIMKCTTYLLMFYNTYCISISFY